MYISQMKRNECSLFNTKVAMICFNIKVAMICFHKQFSNYNLRQSPLQGLLHTASKNNNKLIGYVTKSRVHSPYTIFA